jgi:hypothetical protein
MKVVLNKVILDPRLGRLPKGVTVDLPVHRAEWHIARGEAVRIETKVAQENPSVGAGSAVQSSALPVAQASTQTTLKPSGDGAKKRGRPRKEA